MTLYDSVLSNLKGVIGSRKDGVLLINLENEYKCMAGEDLPIRKLGYNTTYDFIRSHHDFFSLQGSGKFSRVLNVVGKIENDTTLNLISLIQNTESKYKKRPYDNSYYGYQGGYQSDYQPRYISNYQPHYGAPFQNFRPPPPYQYGFNNFNSPFPVSYAPNLRPPANIICQHPNVGYMPTNGNEDTKKNNLLVPIKCLMSAQKSNVLVISDDEETEFICNSSVFIQTTRTVFRHSRRAFVTLELQELVNIIIDVILEYKPLRCNDVYKIRIHKDLYFQFCQLTGFNIDPVLFYDYVVCSVDSPRIQTLYKNLIYLDPSKNDCIFNTKSLYSTKMNLPDYEFDYQAEYVVEIVKKFHDNLIAFKFPSKLNSNLEWKKATISEKMKEIIENQHFWSWIPGGLCLVQLPYSIVKKHGLTAVERAIIIATEMAVSDDIGLHNSQRYLIHKTSFYLIDNQKVVDNLFSCASSFNEVKRKAKTNNDSELTFVCNMSVCAKNTPSKIQFTRLENYNDVCNSFLDKDSILKENPRLVLKNIKKMSSVFHFQPMFSCLSKVYSVVKETRTLTDYKDIETVVAHVAKTNETVIDEYNDVIVISDDDDVVNTTVNGHLDSEEIINVDSSCSDNETGEMSLGKHVSVCPPDAVISSLHHFSQSENHLGSTLCSAEKHENTVLPIVSYSESDDGHDTAGSELDDSGHLQMSGGKHEIVLSNSIINYLENNSNPARKCLIPLTIDLANSFNGRVVKLLHIQTGSAVLMLFDSVKLMRRKIKMMALKKQRLQKAEKVLIGDFFIWRPQSEDSNNDDYFLVEVIQLVSKLTVLTNNVHQGVLAVVNIVDLYCLPEDNNGDIYGHIQTVIGPAIGAFDLHMFPDWFTPDDRFDFANQLFTAFFADDGKLVLEYFEEPCRFLNIEMIGSIERSLTINHCNIKSRQFIEMLSKNLLQCRLFVGNILQMLEFNDGYFEELSITKVLSKVTNKDKRGVWFASVLERNDGDGDGDCNEKLSPHNYMDDQFCVDRVTMDDRRHCLHLMESQNINIDVPDNFEGLYKFDRQQIEGSLKGNEEFLTRYMLAAAAGIPDLKYLCNKLIFDIRAF